MADREDRTFAPGETAPPKDKRPEAGKVQSANPSQGDGRKPDAADVNDAEAGSGLATPSALDLHKLGSADNPQEDWGEPADEGAIFSSNHARRAEKTEAERSQGAKTRTFNKDMMSRRT